VNSFPISVVVPTKDRPDALDRCLSTLGPELGADDELVVVDSASSDPRVREVAEKRGASYLRMDVRGAARARNAGWRAARHDVIAFVDDDVVVGAGWADALRSAFRRHPDIGLLTGRVEAGNLDGGYPASVEPWTDEKPFERWEGRRRGISGNAACTRPVLERVGGFDEALGPGSSFRSGEDKDIFDRIIAAGVEGLYDPSVLAYHDQWRSRTERLGLEWDYGIAAGAYFAKVPRIDRRRTKVVASDLIWRWCIKDLATCIRKRYKTGTLCAIIRSAGLFVGFVRGMALPIRNGHYRRRPGRL